MARLPVPGSDNGTWGDVLNEYLQVSHDSSGALKADAVSSASIQDGSVSISKLDISSGSDGQVLTKNSSAAGGLEWGALPTELRSVYPLSAYGFYTATDDISRSSTISSIDKAFFARVFVPAGRPITAFGAIVASGGTVGAGGLNGFSVYTDSGTFVTSTPNDNTMWQSSGWVTKTLSSPIAAEASDRFVYVGLSVEGYSVQPNIFYSQIAAYLTEVGGGYLVSHRRSFPIAISSWPASFNPATYGGASGGYIPLVALA